MSATVERGARTAASTSNGNATPKPTLGRAGGREVRRADVIAMVALAALAFALSAHRMDAIPWYGFDEVYHAYTGGQYAAGNEDAFLGHTVPPHQGVAYAWDHPPVGLWLIAAGVRLLGDEALGWRLPSALFGAVGVALMYLLGARLSGSRLVASLSAASLPMSGLYLVQSRAGMLGMFLAVFAMAALLALHAYLCAPPDRVRGPLLAVGLFVGLAVATKWSGAFLLPPVALAVLWRWRGLRLHRAWAPLALLALPLAVYLLAYGPYFAAGNSLGEWVEQHRQMLRYHATLVDAHPYRSRWWT